MTPDLSVFPLFGCRCLQKVKHDNVLLEFSGARLNTTACAGACGGIALCTSGCFMFICAPVFTEPPGTEVPIWYQHAIQIWTFFKIWRRTGVWATCCSALPLCAVLVSALWLSFILTWLTEQFVVLITRDRTCDDSNDQVCRPGYTHTWISVQHRRWFYPAMLTHTVRFAWLCL